MKRKHIYLTISVVLTLFIFTMSMLPGTASGELSSGLSLTMKNIWDQIFVNRPIDLDTMHQIVRKGAHVFEFFILGISYYFTARAWHLSILKVLVIGLLTAGIDELIQSFVPGRMASWLDIFIYDFGGFALGFGLMLLILNRRTKKDLVDDTMVLTNLADNKLTPEQAYDRLYDNTNPPLRLTNRAHFVKLKIIVPDDPAATKFLRVLFFFPIPIGIVTLGLRFVKQNVLNGLSKEDIINIVHSKGIRITVNAASGEKVIIKTF